MLLFHDYVHVLLDLFLILLCFQRLWNAGIPLLHSFITCQTIAPLERLYNLFCSSIQDLKFMFYLPQMQMYNLVDT